MAGMATFATMVSSTGMDSPDTIASRTRHSLRPVTAACPAAAPAGRAAYRAFTGPCVPR